MVPSPADVAQIRLDNALRLFDEFVHATVKHPDAATLRGLERRFAERVLIQPSYWSQIKSRSRQIGERLARQFEQCCHKPHGWMDQGHGGASGHASITAGAAGPAAAPAAEIALPSSAPRDDDERFIVGLVLTYYRRHPQRARTRLLDLLGEVLGSPQEPVAPAAPRPGAGPSPSPAAPARTEAEEALWLRTRSGVAPLKKKR